MITKFKSEHSENITIEFQRVGKSVLVSIDETVKGNLTYLDAKLSEENLFSLIGQLLRIQSEIKKNNS